MGLYPGASRAAVSPNRSPRQGKVRLFVVHHYAGTQDPESAWRRFNSANDRSVSPNYQVNADGSVFEVVPPDAFRAWTTGAIDHQAVTCETQNTGGAPLWGISRESHEAIAHLIAWAAQRYGFPIQRGAVADGNVVTVPGVVGHRETPAGRQTSTSCPGPSMDLDYLVARAREIASGAPAGSTPQTEEEEGDEMRAIKLAGAPDSGVIIRGSDAPYAMPEQVFNATVGGLGLVVRELARWQYDTVVREQWAAFDTAKKLANENVDADDRAAIANETAAAVRKAIIVDPAPDAA